MKKSDIRFVVGKVVSYKRCDYHDEFGVWLELSDDSDEAVLVDSSDHYGDRRWHVTVSDALHPRRYENQYDERPIWERQQYHGLHGLWRVVEEDSDKEIWLSCIEIDDEVVSFDLKVARKGEGGDK